MKQLYRILSQDSSMQITAETTELTKEEAREAAIKMLQPADNYDHFVLQPIGTAKGWKYGHINFCPRCGKSISEAMFGDSGGAANNEMEFDCPHCEATVYTHIIRTIEEQAETHDEDEW